LDQTIAGPGVGEAVGVGVEVGRGISVSVGATGWAVFVAGRESGLSVGGGVIDLGNSALQASTPRPKTMLEAQKMTVRMLMSFPQQKRSLVAVTSRGGHTQSAIRPPVFRANAGADLSYLGKGRRIDRARRPRPLEPN